MVNVRYTIPHKNVGEVVSNPHPLRRGRKFKYQENNSCEDITFELL